MSDQGDDNFMRYIYRGEVGERIPREATHIFVGEDCTFVRANAFLSHENIVELVCHDRVKKIGERVFSFCFSLKRVIMPGVKIVGNAAFENCRVLTDVECNKLEIIGEYAFGGCRSLKSINLPSARIVEMGIFDECFDLADVKFSSKLERIGWGAFLMCESLERITIPFKDSLISHDDVFAGCRNLTQVSLFEGVLHETIAVLQLEEWRDDMNEEIDSINQILPNVYAGDEEDDGQKARAIQEWIRSVLRKISQYQAEHQRLLDEAVSTLQLVLPHDIMINSVLPFLALPANTFEVEDMEEDE